MKWIQRKQVYLCLPSLNIYCTPPKYWDELYWSSFLVHSPALPDGIVASHANHFCLLTPMTGLDRDVGFSHGKCCSCTTPPRLGPCCVLQASICCGSSSHIAKSLAHEHYEFMRPDEQHPQNTHSNILGMEWAYNARTHKTEGEWKWTGMNSLKLHHYFRRHVAWNLSKVVKTL